ncbi:MAG: hypothetical protein M1827_001255 [Pycnora praestabilis]|nr:MAG: hypothetical protein M1827_001255 [Pycnora praestabilis]
MVSTTHLIATFSSILLVLPLIFTVPSTRDKAHLQVKTKRARFGGIIGGVEQPEVGPPNGQAICNRRYGKPVWDDCQEANKLIWNLELEPWPHYPPTSAAAIEMMYAYLLPGVLVSPRLNMVSQGVDDCYMLTQLQMIGDCFISLLAQDEGPGHLSSDLATWRDVDASATDIIRDCIFDENNPHEIPDESIEGGSQIFGEQNDLIMYVYALDSEFGEEMETDYNVISNTLVSSSEEEHIQQQLQAHDHDSDQSSEDEAPASKRPRTCGVADYCGVDGDCCEDYECGYNPIKVATISVLFGTQKLLSGGGFGLCEPVYSGFGGD